MKEYYVYIITNYEQTTLYIGITSNLIKRIYEHKNKLTDGFSKKYNLQYLVYYEIHNDVNIAISREKLIKKWKRQWKIDLIKKINPQFIDLYNNGNIMPLILN
ncbi:MAG: GIY-YIG nuclease family protein [Candidatus Gastranaerophilaceae bacterium]|jgi:putative endonuclease